MRNFILGMIVSLALFPSVALTAPFLHDPFPSNNAYIGGGTGVISINITDDNLNANSVLLHIISLNAYQQGENWDTSSMSCAGSSTEWNCTKSLSFAIAGSDTIELLYFEANDTDSISGNNGTSSNPLRFTLDRNPPVISFTSPTNESYVSGNKTIAVTVNDASSGVNNNTVQYSTDGSQWTALGNITSTSFSSIWNTTTFSNNQTVTLRARASDVIGNSITEKINVTVDNEIPELAIIFPSPTTLTGDAQLKVNASDYYSGIDLANVRYTAGGLSGALGCAGTKWNATCTAVLSTSSLSDGNYSLKFTVTDSAGNSRNASVEIKTKNTQPTITILEPTNNALIWGNILVRTTLANTEGSVSSAEVSLEKTGNTTTKTMTCNANFTACNYSLDTTLFADGGYTMKVKAVNSLNADISSSIAATIDNKKPTVAITHPTADVKGDFEIKADVIDDNVDKNKVTFALSTSSGPLACTVQTASKLTCSTTFNSKQLADGKYFLNVSAIDKAGNSFTASKEIIIANQAASNASQTSVDGSASSTTETQEEKEEKSEEESSKTPFTINLPFKPEYIILGIVIASVLVVAVILLILAKQRLGKNIITE